MGGKLNIESLQDEERFKTKSSGGGLEVEFGFGNNWSLSGYGNTSKGTTHRKQVNEQAGIFAEEGGYHINADSVQLKGGAIAAQEGLGSITQGVSVSLTVGSQRNVNETNIYGTQLDGSSVNAGGKVIMQATGAGQQSTIRIAGSDVAGHGGTHLKADGNINAEGLAQTHKERSTNHQFGWNAGVAVAVGGGVSLGVTGGANYAKGYANGDDLTWRNSHIGSQHSLTTIESGGTFGLKGAQVMGERVGVKAKAMQIESLQDIMQYRAKQMNVSGQVTIGYGVSAGGSYGQSKMHSDYQSVKEQSGIFAGDGGYTIDIAGHSHLEGGLVTSTRQAESQGLNRFKTGTLSYGDIANHANYRGSAMSMEGQITLAGQDGPKKVGNQQLLDVAKYAGESQRALGVGQTRDSQQSTTRSGINTANLEITDMARQQMQLNYQTAPAIQMNSGITVGNPHPVKRDNPVSLQAHLAGIKTDTDTQTVAQQAQALTNRFDKDKVQRELDFQVNTTKQFGQTLAEAKRQTKAHLLTNASEQTKQYVDWAFDTLGAGLTTGSVQAAGVAAVSPFANRTIKQLTTDRQTGETNLITNTLAHAALGALEAKATGNNAAAGAMAGAGGELAAHFAAKAYGVDGKTKTTQDLTEQEKATVKTLGQLGGMAAGGLIGDNSQSAVSSMQIAERAVEHNAVAQGDIHSAYQRLLNGEDIEVVLRDLEHLSQKERDKLLADCDAACRQVVPSLLMAANDFSEEQTIAIGSILSKIPAEQRSRVDMLVQSENSKTLEAIENSKSDVEKHIALAVKVMRFFQAENAVSGGKPNKPKLTKSSPDNKSITQRNSINTTYKAKEELTDRLAAQMSKPLVNDPNLKKIMDDLYRENAKIGSGSTADAVRHENATGQPVGNKFHSIKAQNYSSALRKWIDKNPNASREDIRAAELVLRDLNNSLKGK